MTFNQWLNKVRVQIFDAAFDFWYYTESELAREADLSPTTVYNLRTGKTKEPRMSTIYKLGRAVGIDVKLLEKKRNAKKRTKKSHLLKR